MDVQVRSERRSGIRHEQACGAEQARFYTLYDERKFIGSSLLKKLRGRLPAKRRLDMRNLVLILMSLALLPSIASAQARKPSSIAELVTYRGADREALLYAGAKTEGKVVWYTSLTGDSYTELVTAFETKYAGVIVASFRAARAEMIVRPEE